MYGQQQQQKPQQQQPYELPINDDNAPDLYIPFMSLITYVLLCALCYGTAGQFNPEIILDVTTKCIFIQLLEVLLFKFGIYTMTSSSGGGGGTNMGLGGTEQSVISFLDLFAFTGYKYLALSFNMIIGFSVGMMMNGGGGEKVESSSNIESGDDDAATAAAEAANDVVDTASASLSDGGKVGGYGQKGYYIMFLWTASSLCYFMLKTMANNIQKQHGQQYQKGPKREFLILGFGLSQFVTLWFLGQTKFLN